MLEILFKAILLTSCIGTALSMILLLLRPTTKKFFSSAWHYYIWLVVLLVMLLPVRFHLPTSLPASSIPNAVTPTVQTVANIQANELLERQSDSNTPQTTTIQPNHQFLYFVWENKLSILSRIWILGAILLLFAKLLGYAVFLHRIRKHSDLISCPMLASFTDRKVLVRTSDKIHSPLMVGIFRPTLLLPKTEITPEQLEHILAHETTHLKRNDICYKWFVLFVKCIHWFNPMIYILQNQINLECEISCDLAVTKNMNKAETISYVNTILALLADGQSKPIPLTTGMTGSKKNLKRRFMMMKNPKTVSKWMSVFSVIFAIVMLSTTIFASGALSYFVSDDYTVEITNNGEKIALAGKPFIENGCVYVPLRETLEKAGFHDGNSNIRWNDGQIEVSILQSTGETGLFHLEIGNRQMGLKHIDATALYTASIEEPTAVRMSIEMENPPVLKGWTTYVPIENINYMLYGFFNIKTADGALHKISVGIYNKNGADITTQFNDAKQLQQESEYMKNPEYTATNFFTNFESRDFEAMKRYCTDNCITAFFKEDAVFGMKKASLESLDINPLEYAKSSNDFNILVNVGMEPAELSVFDPEQTQTSFYVCLVRQPDGRYLIDSFATGL